MSEKQGETMNTINTANTVLYQDIAALTVQFGSMKGVTTQSPPEIQDQKLLVMQHLTSHFNDNSTAEEVFKTMGIPDAVCESQAAVETLLKNPQAAFAAGGGCHMYGGVLPVMPGPFLEGGANSSSMSNQLLMNLLGSNIKDGEKVTKNEGEMNGGTQFLVYFWREAHDFLSIEVDTSNGKIKSSKWWNALE